LNDSINITPGDITELKNSNYFSPSILNEIIWEEQNEEVVEVNEEVEEIPR
jgi:hypothetical protein